MAWPRCTTLQTVETRWLTADQQRAWRRFIAVAQLLPHDLDQDMRRRFDLSMHEYWVLAMLSEQPESSLRMQELARRSTSSPSRLSHTIGRLEERGLVCKAREGGDRRGQRAVLTDAGRDLVVKAAPHHVRAVLETMFDGLSNEQVAAISAAFDTILQQLDPNGDRSPGGRV